MNFYCITQRLLLKNKSDGDLTVELGTNCRNLLKRVEAWDLRTFLDFYESSFSRKQRVILFSKVYSFFGNIFFWGLIWLSLGIYGLLTKDYYLFILMTGGFQQSIIIHILVKHVIIKRNRPYIKLKEKGVKKQDELIKELDYGFPSGHVAFLLFFGVLFAFYWQSWIFLIIVLLLNIIMGLSRLILGVHFPLDVVAGFLFGALYILLYLGFTYQIWVDFYYLLGHLFYPF